MKYRWTTTTNEIARVLLEHKNLTKNELINAVLKSNRSMTQHTVYMRISELEKKRLIVKFGESYKSTVKFAEDYIKNAKIPVNDAVVDLLVLKKRKQAATTTQQCNDCYFLFCRTMLCR